MDEADIRLIQLLMMNSRSPYRELADALNVSLQAVHRRIQLMVESRVIQGFTASISPAYLGAIGVDVVGSCEQPLTEDTVKTIGQNEFVRDVFDAAGGFVLVSGLIRKHSDLDSYLQFLTEKGRLRDLWTGLQSFGFAGKVSAREEADERELTPLDFRIVNVLRADSRKPIMDIAEEIGVSSKTVARRLDKMIDGKKVNFSVKWYPGMSAGIISLMIINLREGADKKSAAVRLVQHFSPRVVFLGAFSNHPGLLGTISWTPTLAEQNRLTGELTKEDSVGSVVTYVLLKKYEFPTWVDEMISSRASKEVP